MEIRDFKVTLHYITVTLHFQMTLLNLSEKQCIRNKLITKRDNFKKKKRETFQLA